MLIGLTGKAGVGKSTIAYILAREYGYVCVPFAEPLKDMLRAIGLTHDELYGDKKEVVNADYGVTPRHMMQTLGTEWGRNLIGQDVWVEAWKRSLYRRYSNANIVVDDVRFLNEVAAVRALGGKVVNLNGSPPLNDITNRHASESQDLPFDLVVYREDLTPKQLTTHVLACLA
jgi:hypothetical protein